MGPTMQRSRKQHRLQNNDLKFQNLQKGHQSLTCRTSFWENIISIETTTLAMNSNMVSLPIEPISLPNKHLPMICTWKSMTIKSTPGKAQWIHDMDISLQGKCRIPSCESLTSRSSRPSNTWDVENPLLEASLLHLLFLIDIYDIYNKLVGNSWKFIEFLSPGVLITNSSVAFFTFDTSKKTSKEYHGRKN